MESTTRLYLLISVTARSVPGYLHALRDRSVAIITTNVDSSITVESSSEVKANGKEHCELTQAVGLMLSAETAWLRSVIEVEEREWELSGRPGTREVSHRPRRTPRCWTPRPCHAGSRYLLNALESEGAGRAVRA